MERNVFITGSSSGLGRETALIYASHGYRVFAGVRRPEDGPSLTRLSPAITPVTLDLSDPQQIAAAARRADEACGESGLSTLINVAGYALYGPIEYAAQTDVTALFDVLTFGPYRLTNALLPALKRAAKGGTQHSKVLNIVSWASLDAGPFVGFYSAAKAAILRLTQAQFFELQRFNVDAIAVVPGLMKTPFLGKVDGQIGETIAHLPPEGRRDYGKHLQHMASMSAAAPKNPLAASPAAVAKKIFAIGEKRRAKYQYNLGLDTKLVDFMTRFFPLWLLGALKRTMFGLNS
jgi:NAD(P)-dependent dehydrogenase (short-subunit alcohol dehydrogenase family)